MASKIFLALTDRKATAHTHNVGSNGIKRKLILKFTNQVMDFLTYKKFHEFENAEALVQILRNNQIKFEVTQDRESLDSLYGDKYLNKEIFVKIKKEDFSKVDLLIKEDSEKYLDTIDKGHYLYEFTDEELFEILSKPEEWNDIDYQLSKKILKERGVEVNAETITLLRKQRIKELSKPEESSKVWIYSGYLLALFGGLLGIFMGITLITTKKTLPDGRKVYVYSTSHRKHGTKIFIIGIVMLLISLLLKITEMDF